MLDASIKDASLSSDILATLKEADKLGIKAKVDSIDFNNIMAGNMADKS